MSYDAVAKCHAHCAVQYAVNSVVISCCLYNIDITSNLQYTVTCMVSPISGASYDAPLVNSPWHWQSWVALSPDIGSGELWCEQCGGMQK